MPVLRQGAGIHVRVKSALTWTSPGRGLARNFGLEEFHADYRALLNDPEIDVIDICTPPFLHPAMTMEALEAGKHVICEKPLTGYFGAPGDPEPIGDRVCREAMYASVLRDLEKLETAVRESDKLFMYAENYVYSPNILKAAEIIRARKSKILFMKGEESLKGSTSPVAGRWDKTGGGSLMRVGCHPVGGILWLKNEEAWQGAEISNKSVICDTARMTDGLTEREQLHKRAARGRTTSPPWR